MGTSLILLIVRTVQHCLCHVNLYSIARCTGILDLCCSLFKGEDGETRWVLYQLGFYVKLILGILGIITSVVWITHIVIYMLIDPPLSPFLNDLFIKLDDVFPLFGTLAFGLFCLYLTGATHKCSFTCALNSS